MCGIRALLTATMELLIYVVCVLLGYALIRLCFHFVIILFTDISVFWDLIKEFFKSLGGFWGIVGGIITIGIVCWLGSLVLPLLVIVGQIIYYVAAAALGIIYVVFEFVEEKSKYGYGVVVTKIANRLVKSQGGSQ